MVRVEIIRFGESVNSFTVLDAKRFPFQDKLECKAADIQLGDYFRAKPINKSVAIHSFNLYDWEYKKEKNEY